MECHNMSDFKYFLLNEETSYFSHKVSNILTALHDLKGDMKHLGSRQLNRMAEAVVNQIRKILHSHWSDKQFNHLKKLQQVGVGIMKAIEEKGDVKATILGAIESLEGMTGKMKEPVSDIDMGGEPAKLAKGKPEQPKQPQVDPMQQQMQQYQPGVMPGGF